MIVVVIIGVTYALVLSNFNTKKQVVVHHIKEIKQALLPLWKRGMQLDFYLIDSCKESVIFINHTYKPKLQGDIKDAEFDKIKVYKADETGDSKKIEFTPIMIDKHLHTVCFKYTLFPNGSNSSYIINKNKIYYIMYPYFQDVNSTDTLQEAIDMLEEKPYKGVTIDAVRD